jgi:tRNA pseudouridine32 synthase/23S rRNA pseudouridine746 synthase
MNNPFYYTPSEECRAAVHELIEWLSGERSTFCDHLVDTAFRAEIDKGKMFGVLIVEGEETALTRNISVHGKQFHYLAGYSGQICSRSDWPEFVPAVFDYLQPGGYFKQHEEEITQLNDEINNETASLLADKPLTPNTPHLPPSDKRKREGESDEDYIRRRQFENAELHRWKLRQRKIDEEKKAAENHITSSEDPAPTEERCASALALPSFLDAQWTRREQRFDCDS